MQDFNACAGQVMREDSCNQYVECDDCIGKGVGCVWCPDNPVSIVIITLQCCVFVCISKV